MLFFLKKNNDEWSPVRSWMAGGPGGGAGGGRVRGGLLRDLGINPDLGEIIMCIEHWILPAEEKAEKTFFSLFCFFFFFSFSGDDVHQSQTWKFGKVIDEIKNKFFLTFLPRLKFNFQSFSTIFYHQIKQKSLNIQITVKSAEKIKIKLHLIMLVLQGKPRTKFVFNFKKTRVVLISQELILFFIASLVWKKLSFKTKMSF